MVTSFPPVTKPLRQYLEQCSWGQMPFLLPVQRCDVTALMWKDRNIWHCWLGRQTCKKYCQPKLCQVGRWTLFNSTGNICAVQVLYNFMCIYRPLFFKCIFIVVNNSGILLLQGTISSAYLANPWQIKSSVWLAMLYLTFRTNSPSYHRQRRIIMLYLIHSFGHSLKQHTVQCSGWLSWGFICLIKV